MDTSESCDNPIDLSRRCDSVETSKTPSPYNTSSFAETSPSLESPTSNSREKSVVRSGTPTNGYQSSQITSQYPYVNEKQSSPPPPPPKSMPLHHLYMQEQSITSNDDEFNPYVMHAIQHKLHNIPATVMMEERGASSSPESSTQYPMVMGRDGKLTRPFKAYQRDSLSNPLGSISTSNPMEDNWTSTRYINFRQKMIEQFHAANGGQATVTNPKMRRTNTQKISESEASAEMELQQQKQELANQINCQSDSSDGNGKKQVKDNAYYERRRKNNAAAKKSRDRRRIKEDEIAIRAAYLERENMELKIELSTIKRQIAQYVNS